jgi:hypothetical protein
MSSAISPSMVLRVWLWMNYCKMFYIHLPQKFGDCWLWNAILPLAPPNISSASHACRACPSSFTFSKPCTPCPCARVLSFTITGTAVCSLYPQTRTGTRTPKLQKRHCTAHRPMFLSRPLVLDPLTNPTSKRGSLRRAKRPHCCCVDSGLGQSILGVLSRR